jgi:hypothetical protein
MSGVRWRKQYMIDVPKPDMDRVPIASTSPCEWWLKWNADCIKLPMAGWPVEIADDIDLA